MTDILEYLSKNPDAYAVIAAVVAGICVIAAALISRRGPNWRLNRRREKVRKKLKETCLHVRVELSDGTDRVDSLCSSVGSNPWVTCRLCRSRFTPDTERTIIDEWVCERPENRNLELEEAFEQAVALRERLDELEGE